MIIEYWKERTVSLYDIRRASGQPINCENGLSMDETLRALRHYGVNNYGKAVGIDASFVLQKAYNGPVITGVGYRQYPSKKGMCSAGNDAQLGGKRDCGFDGAHAILVVGNVAVKNSVGKITRYDVFARDPDHWEDGRPDYDRITGAQLTKSMNALVYETNWTKTFAIFPTSRKKL